MARINDGVLKEWLDGMVVKSTEYKQEREILRTAINDNYDRLVLKYDKTEVDTLLASLQEELDIQKANVTDVYDKTTADLLLDTKADKETTYSKDEVVVQIGILTGKSGFIDGGNFTDVYSSQFEMIDGGVF